MNTFLYEIKRLVDLEEAFSLINKFTKDYPYTIHQYPAWYRAYIDSFRPSSLFLQVQNTQTGNPIGILPLQVQTYRGSRFWNLRSLVPLGHGPSDFVTFLVDSSQEQGFAYAIAKWLWQNHNRWERLQLLYIPESTCAWKPLLHELQIYGYNVKVEQTHFFEVNTTQAWDEYFESFFKPNNADLLKDIRKLERTNSYPRLESIRSGIEQYLPRLMPIYAKRRSALLQDNKYENVDRHEFLLEVLRSFEPESLVELSMLVSDNGDIWSFQLDWIERGIRYHYMHAYNEKYRQYSPGKLLLYEILKKSFSDPEIIKCNFMRGEAVYKNKFADNKQGYVNIYIENPHSFRSKFTNLAGKITRFRDRIFHPIAI